MPKKEPDKFKFKRNASIGAAAAEEDERFLASCFINTGDVETLVDTEATPRLILGRTGTGKTALINHILGFQNTISLEPQNLSFNFLTNSNLLQFLVASDVSIDLFFKLLWRHVFAVELIKAKFHINQGERESFFTKIASLIVSDKKKQKAVDYLISYGDKFWEDSEFHVKEITNTFQEQLGGKLGTKLGIAEFGAEGSTTLTQQEKAEINSHTQKVLNEIHLKELNHILEFLNEDVFDDDNQPYYICIDRLDENWVPDRVRYLLIRSLLDCVREFNKVRNVKIIVALRSDLIDRVFRMTRDDGFQEEKYRSLYLPLKWTRAQLKQLLDARIGFLIKESYTKEAVSSTTLLPTTINNRSGFDYLVDRTLMRPRELIEFFNLCLEQAEGRANINKDVVVKAEGVYSKNRFRSLQDEYFADYPKLLEFAEVLKKKPKQFKIGSLDFSAIEELCLKYTMANPDRKDYLSKEARKVVDAKSSDEVILAFLGALFQVFYRTGLVGVKAEAYEAVQWSYIGPGSISGSTVDRETSISIHPTFWRVLGTTPA